MRKLRLSLFVITLLVMTACTTPGPTESTTSAVTTQQITPVATSVPTPLVVVGPEEHRPLTLQPQPGEIAETYPLPLDGKLAVAPNEVLILTLLVESDTEAFVSLRVFRPPATAERNVEFSVTSKADFPWTVHRVVFTTWPDDAAVVEVIREMMTLSEQAGLVGCLAPPCNIGKWYIQEVEEAQSYEIRKP